MGTIAKRHIEWVIYSLSTVSFIASHVDVRHRLAIIFHSNVFPHLPPMCWSSLVYRHSKIAAARLARSASATALGLNWPDRLDLSSGLGFPLFLHLIDTSVQLVLTTASMGRFQKTLPSDDASSDSVYRKKGSHESNEWCGKWAGRSWASARMLWLMRSHFLRLISIIRPQRRNQSHRFYEYSGRVFLSFVSQNWSSNRTNLSMLCLLRE